MQRFVENEVNHNKLCLLVFEKKWSGACEIFRPIISKIEKQFVDKILIFNMDLDKNENLSNHYSVQSAPTVLFLINGEVCESLVGVTPYKELEEKIDNILTSYNRSN